MDRETILLFGVIGYSTTTTAVAALRAQSTIRLELRETIPCSTGHNDPCTVCYSWRRLLVGCVGWFCIYFRGGFLCP
jgi:hypothetical protein